jgi:hypothetical protein
MTKSRWIALCVGLLMVTPLLSNIPVNAQSLQANYIPWGVDEYELIGLTKGELSKKFKNTLEFDESSSKLFFVEHNRRGYGRPQFVLTFANDKVVSAKRLFIDGAGCNLWGPNLTSKNEALNFSIEGLSKMSNRDAADEKKLKDAQQRLAEIEKNHSDKQ